MSVRLTRRAFAVASALTVAATTLPAGGAAPAGAAAQDSAVVMDAPDPTLVRGSIGPAVRRGARGSSSSSEPAYTAAATTPSPTGGFTTGTTSTTRIDIGSSPADSTVAASATHVCATARAAFACYNKAGQLVRLGGTLPARPITGEAFFESGGIDVGPGWDGSTTNTTKDARVVYDVARGRFVIVIQSREESARLLIAVSRSANPSDGWYMYASTVADSDANNHDYQKIGTNQTYLLVSERGDDCGTTSCAGGMAYRNYMFTMSDLAVGTVPSRWLWKNTSAGGILAPCHQQTTTTNTFWVTSTGATTGDFWALQNDSSVKRVPFTVQSTKAPLSSASQKSMVLDFSNIGRTPQNAVCRSNTLTYVSGVGKVWANQSSTWNAVQLVQLNTTYAKASTPSITVTRDRVFGRSSAGDSSSSIYHYGWPAVATTPSGDVVVGSVRSNSSIFGELRASVWAAGDSDISSSISTQTGYGALNQYHMAGASTDPSPAGGVYLSQQYGTGTTPAWRIRVTKMLGSRRADLIAESVTGPSTTGRGVQQTYNVRVRNQGDAAASASTGQLRLSTNKVVSTNDRLVKTFSIPALRAGQATTLSMTASLRLAVEPGTYYLGAMLDTDGAVVEHSNANNANPALSGTRGNHVMEVT